jgi:hypothetical protein
LVCTSPCVGLALQTTRLEASTAGRALAAARLLTHLAAALTRLGSKASRLPGADSSLLQLPLVYGGAGGGADVEKLERVALVERLNVLERSFAALTVAYGVVKPNLAASSLRLDIQDAAAAVLDIPAANSRVDPREGEQRERQAKLAAWFGLNRGLLRHIFETKGSRTFPPPRHVRFAVRPLAQLTAEAKPGFLSGGVERGGLCELKSGFGVTQRRVAL